MIEGKSNVHIRPSALHPSPAPLASPFSREFTPAEFLARPALRLAPRKSAFLLRCYQISVGIKLSGMCITDRGYPCLEGCSGCSIPLSPAPLVPGALPCTKSPQSLPTSTATGDGRSALGNCAQSWAPTSPAVNPAPCAPRNASL